MGPAIQRGGGGGGGRGAVKNEVGSIFRFHMSARISRRECGTQIRTDYPEFSSSYYCQDHHGRCLYHVRDEDIQLNPKP